MGFLRDIMLRLQQATARRGRLLELSLGGEQFVLEVARDGAALRRGLAGRRRLDLDRGLVLILPPQTDRGAITTRGMRFAIDVVFLDGAGRVLEVAPSLAPGSFPGHPVPEGGAVVVELAAGAASKAALQPGQSIKDLSLSRLSAACERDNGRVS